MAVIAQTTVVSTGVFTVSKTTLTASDTLTYLSGQKQLLVLTNTTGAQVTTNLKGNAATTYLVDGYGSIDLSAGKGVVVPANGQVAIELDSIALFLKGSSVAVTNGTGLTALLLN